MGTSSISLTPFNYSNLQTPSNYTSPPTPFNDSDSQTPEYSNQYTPNGQSVAPLPSSLAERSCDNATYDNLAAQYVCNWMD